MKTPLIALFLFSAPLSAAWAQTAAKVEALTITHVKKGQEPQKVMSALEQDFPSSIVQDVSTMPGALYGQEGSATEEKPASNPVDMTYYQVKASSKGMNYTAVYDKNGNLVSSHKMMKNTPLPIDAAKNVASQFPDWQMVGDREKITIHNQHNKVAYRVKIKKGNEEKKVFLDGNGHIIRVAKKTRIRV